MKSTRIAKIEEMEEHIVYKMFIFKVPNINIFMLKFYYLEFIGGGNV